MATIRSEYNASRVSTYWQVWRRWDGRQSWGNVPCGVLAGACQSSSDS